MADADTSPARDGAGRFAPGNQLSRGHKPPQQILVHHLRRAFVEALGVDKLAEVQAHHIQLILTAKTGRDAAPLLELLYSYTMGKPLQPVALDVTTDATPAQPISLAPDELAVLERMRSRLLALPADGSQP
jgi:hypothetical protein